MENKGMVVYQGAQMTVPDLRNLAMDFAKSGYFADAREAAQAVVKIQAGVEMGFGPVYSMTKIYIVKGKVMVSAEALGAMVKRSNRYDYAVKSLTDEECVLDFTDNGKSVYTSKFTMSDAKRADLVRQDSGWSKWPRAMLMSKAISQGARIVCPHVIAGVYTPADFGVETDEAGEPAKPTITVEPKQEPSPVEMITDAQRRKIFATANEKGYTEEQVKRDVWDKFVKAHISDLTKVEAGELIEALEASPQPPTPPKTGGESPNPTQDMGKAENPPKIDMPWLIESLNTLKTKAPKTWGPVLVQNKLKAMGATVKQKMSETVCTLPEDAQVKFAEEVQEALKLVGG